MEMWSSKQANSLHMKQDGDRYLVPSP